MDSEENLLTLLDKVLEWCERFGLKQHAKKCRFFLREVVWCGLVNSAEGVKHSPDRVQGLVEMSPSSNAAELQQFLCAVNWMRQSIPEYSRVTAPMYAALERAALVSGFRKKIKLARVRLADTGWSEIVS